MNLPAIDQNGHTLQVGPKGTPGGSQRKAAIMTECGCFPTGFTLCHCSIPFRDKSDSMIRPEVQTQSSILPQTVSLIKQGCLR